MRSTYRHEVAEAEQMDNATDLLPARLRVALLRQYTAQLTPKQQTEREATDRVAAAAFRALRPDDDNL